MLCRHNPSLYLQAETTRLSFCAHIFADTRKRNSSTLQLKQDKVMIPPFSNMIRLFLSLYSLIMLPMLVNSTPLLPCETHQDCYGNDQPFGLCSLGYCRPCTGMSGGTFSGNVGFCFYNTFSRKRHWQQSYDTCKNVGLQMVQIRTPQKQLEVQWLASGRGHYPFWLDLRCHETDEACQRNYSNWKFPDGQSASDVEFNGWELSPDGEILFGSSGKKCATFITHTNYWSVDDCNLARAYETVCEAVDLYEATPSTSPTITPGPTSSPSVHPSLRPSTSTHPSLQPSTGPSFAPSKSLQPSLRPSVQPSHEPSSLPSPPPTTSQSPTSPSNQPSLSIAPSPPPPTCSDHNGCGTDEVCLEGYCRSCGPDGTPIKYTANNGNVYGYCWFNAEVGNFDQAQQKCDDHNMMIVQLRSAEEREFFLGPDYDSYWFWIDLTCDQTLLGPYCYQDPSKVVYPDGSSYQDSGFSFDYFRNTHAETRLCAFKYRSYFYEWDYCHNNGAFIRALCEPKNLYELEPSQSPSTSLPTLSIAPSSKPSETPSLAPSYSSKPSVVPTVSLSPSMSPSEQPSFVPSQEPSLVPTSSTEPSVVPSKEPTMSPTTSKQPTGTPTQSVVPSPAPSLAVCNEQAGCDSSTICRDGFCRSCGPDATAVKWQASSGNIYEFCWFGEVLSFDFYQGKQTCEDLGMQVPQIRSREKNDVLIENLGGVHYGFWMDVTCDGATYGNEACQNNLDLWKYPDGTSMIDSFYYMKLTRDMRSTEGTIVGGAPGKNCANFQGPNWWNVAVCSNNRFYTKRLLCEPSYNYTLAALSAENEVITETPTSSVSPSNVPSFQPSSIPSSDPSNTPSSVPSASPSSGPTNAHSDEPTNSAFPSRLPSLHPSWEPSLLPSSQPSGSAHPSLDPSSVPTNSAIPSRLPSSEPSGSAVPSSQPSRAPSSMPSILPSSKPSEAHSQEPTSSAFPSQLPSTRPSSTPSSRPSKAPSSFPSSSPSSVPSSSPSKTPTSLPSFDPSSEPTDVHSNEPTRSISPSHIPTFRPSSNPSFSPSKAPASIPTNPPTSTWNVIFSEGFESGTFGSFTDGGSDASLNIYQKHSGSYSLKLRDDSSTSVATTGTYPLGDMTTLQVEFWFRFGGMERGEEFYLQYREGDGSGWNSAGTWTRGSASYPNNNVWYTDTVTIDAAGMASIQLRFVCNASSNRDKVFIDDIIFRGRS